MVELRKRKDAPPAPAAPPSKKSAPKSKVTRAKEEIAEKVETVKNEVTGKTKPGKSTATSSAGPPKVGEIIDLANFGGEVETHEGAKVTLAKLVEESEGGVVLFTYPKASTPGCTKQVCAFRDSYTPLTATGYLIYGLSNDSPKSNTTFYTKQKLNYPLLCDPAQTLISAIGLKKTPSGTIRGVFVVDKDGKVLAAEGGSPEGTVAVVKRLVEGSSASSGPKAAEPADAEAAKVADQVADTAATLDGDGA